ncbi:acetyltransferase [Paraburkholderia madseniana]|uniref:Acetyltransferase n=1 Tax=Paraburkholderia madseniana TaxID=2599607 RepID=A0A6N6W1Z9_9BURK|nr:DHH family phosphoesterase [Paraburkholderia madseniana]KAE8753580.1 acetyltransferase [Paraburkholderia madseniana]
MKHFDVFNGDADGICALHQLRLAKPLRSLLITGVKRDVALLSRVPARRDISVTVLDISLDTNRTALLALLEHGVKVEYFDHHFAGAIPEHSDLSTYIETTPDICTSTLVDRHLGGQHRLWAIVGAYGDNLAHAAQTLAESRRLQPGHAEQLRELGESINYNAYGDNEADLLIPPARLYETLRAYADPFQFAADEPIAQTLCDARRHDMELALGMRPSAVLSGGSMYVLPNKKWARRVRGIFSNFLASNSPDRAHAVLTVGVQGDYTVSVRAPLANPYGADELCRRFASGGGRVGAAGIGRLPHDRLRDFMQAFDKAFDVGVAVTGDTPPP